MIRSHTRPAIGIAGYSFWCLRLSSGELRRLRVVRCRQHGRRILAHLAGVETIEAAEALRGAAILVSRDQVEVGEDEYLWADLIGCEVVDLSGRRLGCVEGMSSFGAQDILGVRGTGPEERAGVWMLPFIEDVVREVDLEARRIVVELIEGLDACFTPRS